eukprot:scaffold4688_cov110-Skeletonema_marinoi.AAC.4
MGKKWTPGPSPPAPSAALTIPSGHLVRLVTNKDRKAAANAANADGTDQSSFRSCGKVVMTEKDAANFFC